jgi:hypothetical protein
MGITFKNNGHFRFNKSQSTRPINGQYVAEVTECSYCQQIIHNGVFLFHIRDCPQKDISKKLTISQQKDEIALYIFKLVPEFSDYVEEYCYFQKRGINLLSIGECGEFAIKLYLAIRFVKTRHIIPINAFVDLDLFAPHIYEYFSSLYFKMRKEDVTIINGYDIIIHEMFPNMDWIDSKDSIPYYLWNSLEDGFYRPNYIRNWE